MRFKDIKLSYKLGGVFIVMLILIGIVGGINSSSINLITDSYKKIINIRSVHLKHTEEMLQDITSVRSNTLIHLLSGDIKLKDKLSKSIKEREESVTEHIHTLFGNKSGDDPEEKTFLKSFTSAWRTFISSKENLLSSNEPKSLKTKKEIKNLEESFNDLEKIIKEHLKVEKTLSNEALSMAVKQHRFADTTDFIITSMAILLSLFFWNLLKRYITDPIDTIKATTVRISKGEHSLRLPLSSEDEIGKLSKNFNTMMDRLEENEAHLEKLNNKLVRANKLKSEFLSNISHELRTPLNSILGFSELLKDPAYGQLNEKQNHYIEYIHSSGEHLLELINNLLDMSKIEAGRLDLYREECNFSEVMGEIIGIIKPQAFMKNIALQVHNLPKSPILKLDHGKFKQVMFNLLSNAIKFTPEGGRIDVHIGLKDLAPADKFGDKALEISVKDTGIGISQSEQAHIFDEFYQVDGSSKRKAGGTGLGLALTKKLIELHGGRIWLESEVNKGSNFTFMLPTTVFSFKEPLKLMRAEETSIESALRHTVEDMPLVLVVEDNLDVFELMKNYLTEAGYRVAGAYDGADALKKAKELNPFMITLDIMLPKYDGWEVLSKLKSNPETYDIPVIIVSALDDKELAFGLGAVDYIEKPINKDAFLGKLGRASLTTKVKRNPYSILIIDDEPASVEYLSDILKEKGFGTLHAFGGREGIDMAIERDPDLIILDLIMPEVNGFDVVNELKAHPTAKDIPVIIFTGKELSAEDKKYLGASIGSVIQKGGINTDDILNEIWKLERFYPARAKMLDTLTGMYNLRYFNKRIVHEIARAKRYGRVFSMLLLDIDKFEEFNKLNGRLNGDDALKKIVSLIEKHIRKADPIIRYRGDEFIVILPETTKESAIKVGNKIRLLAGRIDLAEDKAGTIKLTVTIGVVTYPQDGKEKEKLVNKLESLIKKGFKEGGNRLVT